MRGTVAKRLRKAAKLEAKGDPGTIVRIPVKYYNVGTVKHPVTFTVFLDMFGPGWIRFYSNYKREYKS